MDIQEITPDGVTIYYCNTKVLWGLKEKELCFVWEGHKMISFTKQSPLKIPSKHLREKIRLYLKDPINKENDKYLKLRSLFINQWGEIFLVSIYIDNGVTIFIICLNRRSPHYHFQMVSDQ